MVLRFKKNVGNKTELSLRTFEFEFEFISLLDVTLKLR